MTMRFPTIEEMNIALNIGVENLCTMIKLNLEMKRLEL